MLSERILSRSVAFCTNNYLKLKPLALEHLPLPEPDKSYMLYIHIPFCERLCPYCSFNRFPFREDRAREYYANVRKEMENYKEQGYDFESIYIGGGTPTIMLDELCRSIDFARELFSIKEASSETNPNHLIPEYLEQLSGRVQRLSVGVQSFDNALLKQMGRFDKYGSAELILERIKDAVPYFESLNVDMIYNFPAQTEESLRHDLECILKSQTTQTTFYPLMASPSVERSLAATVGKVDYEREYNFYEIICDTLASPKDGLYDFGSAWTFNRKNQTGTTPLIDEYVVNFEEYPAIGSGAFSYLGDALYVNTFSVKEYNASIPQGRVPLMGYTKFSKRDRMRYRFMMQLFGTRLDKEVFKQDFGCSVEHGLPFEMAFMSLNGAFSINNKKECVLSEKGRYLLVVMMRQFFIGVNNLRDQARAALKGEERTLIFGEGCSQEPSPHRSEILLPDNLQTPCPMKS